MNTIENGMDRQPELALGTEPNPMSSVPASHETQGEAIKPHAFSRLPSVGVPDRAAREWAVADIEGLKQIAEPADRKLRRLRFGLLIELVRGPVFVDADQATDHQQARDQ